MAKISWVLLYFSSNPSLDILDEPILFDTRRHSMIPILRSNIVRLMDEPRIGCQSVRKLGPPACSIRNPFQGGSMCNRFGDGGTSQLFSGRMLVRSLLAVLLTIPLGLHAQQYAGTIVGTVTDSTGAAI